MKDFLKSSGSIAMVLVFALISIMPLVILGLPWWADVIYYGLLAFGFSTVAFPAAMIWAFVVEIQRPFHDWFGIAFFVVFGIFALYFILTLLSNRR